MGIKEKIISNPKLKKFIHRLIIPENQARPRLWVKWFLNPFKHKKGKGSKICRWTRMDVLPFNKFELGEYSTIEDFATVNNGVGDVIIGVKTRIGLGNVIIGPVQIGNNVMLAQNIVLSGLNHSYENIEIPIMNQQVTKSKIIIEDDCWIGANSIILSGIQIGKHSVVAGGSVVTKNVPPYSVVAGNPAKILKKYNFESNKWEKVT
ncbi:MAG TPA: acyltransferase [Ignavibacteria bacterium]|nr:acyltransferase [Ignavibacteria bacterium]